MAIAQDAKLLAGVFKPYGKELSRKIIPTIADALKKAKVSLAHIDCFGVGIGPGSFTGLRVGLATIKGLAFLRNKPVVSVASLEVMAYALREIDGFVCPIVDAKRELVYTALYEVKKTRITRRSRYLLTSVKELLEKPRGDKKITFLGDGLLRYQAVLLKALGKRASFISDELMWYPKPENLMACVREKCDKKEFSDIDTLVPLYLYPKECQIRKTV
jgi:tRNA threonylcarbamoyladenosine biosynthesis protein TsaB